MLVVMMMMTMQMMMTMAMIQHLYKWDSSCPPRWSGRPQGKSTWGSPAQAPTCRTQLIRPCNHSCDSCFLFLQRKMFHILVVLVVMNTCIHKVCTFEEQRSLHVWGGGSARPEAHKRLWEKILLQGQIFYWNRFCCRSSRWSLISDSDILWGCVALLILRI